MQKKKKERNGQKVVELQSVFLSAAADFNVSARALPLGARLSSFPVLPTPGKQKGGGGNVIFFQVECLCACISQVYNIQLSEKKTPNAAFAHCWLVLHLP